MIYDIPKNISISDFSHQELYFIGEFTRTKKIGQYKFTKLKKTTCAKYVLDPDKHIQTLIDKGVITVIETDDENSFTYAMRQKVDLNELKQVQLSLLNRVVISRFPFKSNKGKEVQSLDELKYSFNELEDAYHKLRNEYQELKEIAFLMKEELINKN